MCSILITDVLSKLLITDVRSLLRMFLMHLNYSKYISDVVHHSWRLASQVDAATKRNRCSHGSKRRSEKPRCDHRSQETVRSGLLPSQLEQHYRRISFQTNARHQRTKNTDGKRHVKLNLHHTRLDTDWKCGVASKLKLTSSRPTFKSDPRTCIRIVTSIFWKWRRMPRGKAKPKR